MAKLLVERPRHGGTGKDKLRKNRHAAKRDPENTTCFRSMKMVHRGEDGGYDNLKSLSENLNPLRRFLRTNVGRKWDDVYSEIMAGLNLNNGVQYHVWQHLINFSEVETNTYMSGNRVMVAGNTPHCITENSNTFYAHPQTGILCYSGQKKKHYWRNSRENTQSLNSYRNPKNPLEQYFRIEGIWYKIGFRLPTEDEEEQGNWGHWGFHYNTYSRTTNKEWVKKDHLPWVQKFIDDNNVTVVHRNFNYWLTRERDKFPTAMALFGAALFPISKTQVGKREVKRIEAAIEMSKKKGKAA